MSFVEISRFLSYVLRHNPGALGVHMEKNGWVSVAELMRKMNEQGKNINFDLLQSVVLEDDKQRYSFNEDATKIRANQGHSIAIDLKLVPVVPVECLYHGTAARNITSIKVQGLLKQQRHHVHLSENQDSAERVGARYGKPVILTILAGSMNKAGYLFYRSENNVWLTDVVPPTFIQFPGD